MLTVEEIFSKILAHMIKGVMIHDQMSIAYGFLGLCGYQKLHEHQYYEESKSYKCIQNYFLDHYQKLIPEIAIEKPNIIPVNWYKHITLDVDTSTKRNAIKELMKQWIDWEKDTIKLLETSYKELYDIDEICAAMEIKKLLLDVEEELKYAQHKYLLWTLKKRSISNINNWSD